jgi:hypothetical protein
MVQLQDYCVSGPYAHVQQWWYSKYQASLVEVSVLSQVVVPEVVEVVVVVVGVVVVVVVVVGVAAAGEA